MRSFFVRTIICCCGAMIFAAAASAQGNPRSTIFFPPDPREELPKSVQDMIRKKEIEQSKKDHEEMLKRGEEALKLTQELENSVALNHSVTAVDREKLEELEKVVKKIRNELGGDDDGEKLSDINEEKAPDDVLSGLKALSSATVNLMEELKKTSRFTISAAAIRSSNTVLKVARFLRIAQ